jgi:hypothetical protein
VAPCSTACNASLTRVMPQTLMKTEVICEEPPPPLISEWHRLDLDRS